jgi:hypothetical protein
MVEGLTCTQSSPRPALPAGSTPIKAQRSSDARRTCRSRTAGVTTRDGAAAARRAHNPKVGGSNPSPATVSGGLRRGGTTRSHPEHGRETPQHRRYCRREAVWTIGRRQDACRPSEKPEGLLRLAAYATAPRSSRRRRRGPCRPGCCSSGTPSHRIWSAASSAVRKATRASPHVAVRRWRRFAVALPKPDSHRQPFCAPRCPGRWPPPTASRRPSEASRSRP